MRICLTGTHGCGKTTLLKGLKEKLPNYDIQIESLTRKAVSGADKLNFSTTDESERLISKLYMDSFLKAPVNFIASRGMVDVLAYSLYLRKVNKNISEDTILMLEDLIEKIKTEKIFDLVVYIPIEFDLTKEEIEKEFREGQTNKKYQKDIDTIIKFLLWAYDIPYITITGSVDERVQQVLSHINGK